MSTVVDVGNDMMYVRTPRAYAMFMQIARQTTVTASFATNHRKIFLTFETRQPSDNSEFLLQNVVLRMDN